LSDRADRGTVLLSDRTVRTVEPSPCPFPLSVQPAGAVSHYVLTGRAGDYPRL